MMADDFIGSIAQEDVKFTTEVVTESELGVNYGHLVVYVESTRYIVDDSTFVDIKGAGGTVIGKYAEISDTDYMSTTKGMLSEWLADYFSAGGVPTVFVVICQDKLVKAEDFDADNFAAVFEETATKGYFKTVCISTDDADASDPLLPAACTALAKLCDANDLLSAPALLPYSTATPATPTSDTIYNALKLGNFDAFMVCYPVITDGEGTKHLYNKSLVSLGLALSVQNVSGTYVGNSFDMVKTTQAKASGADNKPLATVVQSTLKANNISYFKYVGVNDESAAAVGATSIKGKLIPAYWIVAYCNYINKCKVANYITTRNVFKSQSAYNNILSMMMVTVNLFVSSGRLKNFYVTAPAYENLPKAGRDEIIINNAWKANYEDDLRKVSVTGTLTISA